MASSLLLLLDDIATMMDDVAVLTKVAAKKTAGVLGDDLALNAQQVAGVKSERELPVVWAVAKGSALNKLMLVPAALAIATWLPWLIAPLMMAGGAFLCFEGVEKLVHKFLHKEEVEAEAARRMEALIDPTQDPVALEKAKITGAIRTDFILSAEIIVITLGAVAGKPFATQLGVLIAMSVAMTVGVYGLVAGIVKLDDVGIYLSQRASGAAQAVGRGIMAFAPWLMRALSVVGTAAMFLVGGGLLVHGVPVVGHAVDDWAKATGGVIGPLGGMTVNLVVGIIVGAVVVGAVELFKRMRGPKPSTGH